MTAPYAYGDVVHTVGQSGRVIRAERKYRTNGYVVQFVRHHASDGTLPRWVPDYLLEPGPLPPAPGGGPNIEQILGIWPGDK